MSIRRGHSLADALIAFEPSETSCFDSKIVRYFGTTRSLMQLKSEGFEFPISHGCSFMLPEVLAP